MIEVLRIKEVDTIGRHILNHVTYLYHCVEISRIIHQLKLQAKRRYSNGSSKWCSRTISALHKKLQRLMNL